MARVILPRGKKLPVFYESSENTSVRERKILSDLKRTILMQEIENAIVAIKDTVPDGVFPVLREHVVKIRRLKCVTDEDKPFVKEALIEACQSGNGNEFELNTTFEAAWSLKPCNDNEPGIFCFSCAEGKFSIDSNGVWFQKISSEGSYEERQKISSPIVVLGQSRTDQKSNWGKLLLWWDQDGNDHRWAMPMALLHTRRFPQVLERLLSEGVTPGSLPKINDLFQVFIKNYPANKRFESVAKLGWYRGCYVFPEEVIGPGKDNVIFQPEDGHILPGYEQNGTAQEWRENVSKFAIGNSMIQFSISCAFAGPLLTLLGLEGGGIHFMGDSSMGKSSICMAAISVWGSPDLKRSWKATVNGLEGTAAQRNDNFLVLDEIKESKPRDVAEAAYLLANGHGKTVMGSSRKLAETLKWRLIYLSNGELSLCEMIESGGLKSYAGQEVRLVDIPADAGAGLGVFEDIQDAPSPKAFSEQLVDSAGKFFGTVGVEFIKTLTEKLKDPAFLKAVKEEYEKIIQKLLLAVKDISPQVGRVAKRFAAVGIAGELATSFGLTGWDKGEATSAAIKLFEKYLSFKGTQNDIDKEKQEIIYRVRQFFEKNSERFVELKNASSSEIAEPAGYIDDKIPEKREVVVLSKVFQDEICKDVSRKKVCEILANSGLLIAPKKGFALNRHIPGKGSPKVYVFSHKILKQD